MAKGKHSLGGLSSGPAGKRQRANGPVQKKQSLTVEPQLPLGLANDPQDQHDADLVVVSDFDRRRG